MVLWYVRLRRAAKKRIYHTELLRAEVMAGPCSKVADPVAKVRQARLNARDVEEIKESRQESQSLDDESEEELSGSETEDDLDAFYR